jgi:hypothetical protein
MPLLVGYGCSKCTRKHELSQFIKEHNIQPGSGQRLSDAIKEKIEALKLKRHPVLKIQPKEEKPHLWQKLKDKCRIRAGIKKQGG